MSQHYILDGYNLLHSTPRWEKLPRVEQRQAFLRYLDEAALSGSARNVLTVVLDGYSVDIQKMRFARLRLVFSENRDADTVIKEHVAEMAHPRQAVVVTNDRGIQAAVRAFGAHVMSYQDFLLLRKKKAALKRIEKMDLPGADAINRELKRLWRLE
jgi:predicted RNA-binding protein with PIN domain